MSGRSNYQIVSRLPLLLYFLILSGILSSSRLSGQGKNIVTVNGTKFEMNEKHFEFTGISFFNAIYNPEFNKSSERRRQLIEKFNEYGINVLRVWCQWDNARGFIDSGKDRTLFNSDGTLNPFWLTRLKSIIEDAGKESTVILLVLFSRESWNENLRLSDEASDRSVAEITSQLKPYGNVIIQVWNEFNYRAIDYARIIKRIDPGRIVTNSPGYAGDLGLSDENRVMDYLSPHTTRDDNRHWEMAETEVDYLIHKYRKPVVDDEPARRGTQQFGGPKIPVYPEDHIIHIYNIWKSGGYIIYHHDMFQTGYGSEAIPSEGVPLPGFSKYHDAVFDFLKNKERYLRNFR